MGRRIISISIICIGMQLGIFVFAVSRFRSLRCLCMYVLQSFIVHVCVLYSLWTALLLLRSGLVVEHFVSPAETKFSSVHVCSACRPATLGTLSSG